MQTVGSLQHSRTIRFSGRSKEKEATTTSSHSALSTSIVTNSMRMMFGSPGELPFTFSGHTCAKAHVSSNLLPAQHATKPDIHYHYPFSLSQDTSEHQTWRRQRSRIRHPEPSTLPKSVFHSYIAAYNTYFHTLQRPNARYRKPRAFIRAGSNWFRPSRNTG